MAGIERFIASIYKPKRYGGNALIWSEHVLKVTEDDLGASFHTVLEYKMFGTRVIS